MNTNAFPSTVSARQIQRDYKSVFAKANQSNQPVVIISNNKPQAAVIGLKQMEEYNKFITEQKFWEEVKTIQEQSKNIKNKKAIMKDVNQIIDQVRQRNYDKIFGRSRHQHIRKRPIISSKQSRENNQIITAE